MIMRQLTLLAVLFTLFACNSAQKKQAEENVTAFFKALKTDDTTAIIKHYPKFNDLGGHYKSDRIEILSTEINDKGQAEVTVQNHFKNIKGKVFSQKITLICSQNNAKIVDSRGIYDFSETDEYQFAVKAGFIPKQNNMSDLEIVAKINASQKLIELLFKEKMEQLRKEVVIENWGWEYGYVKTYADGHGTVINNSNQDFQTLKFTLTFVAQDGSITKVDDGYLGYEELKKGQKRDFTTLTSDIGNATKAYIQIQFDSYELLKQIYAANYAGNEYKLIQH